MPEIKFTYSRTSAGRKHFINADEVRVLLSRLPGALWERLRAVHFNDRAFGNRMLGYVNRGRREIALCALPQRVSLSAFFRARPTRDGRNHSPHEFGAARGHQWPDIAVRRCMLYEVFLHELGHLQVVDAEALNPRRRFAGETKAEEFAASWRRRLWAAPFDHPDSIHNRPTHAELEQPNEQLFAGIAV